MISDFAGFWLTPHHVFNTGGQPITRVFSNGVQAQVRPEGLVVFDFSQWPPGKAPDGDAGWLESVYLLRSMIMNVVVFGFAISLDRHGRDSHVHYITPDHHVHFAAFDDAPMGRQLNRDQTTLIPEQSAVEEALAIAKTIIDANLEKEAGLLVRAIEAKRAHAHEAALTAAWPVLEKLLTRVWIAYLDSNKRRRYPPGVVVGGTRADGGPVDTETYEFIDRRRRDALTNVNSFTAGTISEVLSLLDEIDYSAYRAMARARKARNDWMHDLKPVDSLDVDAAFDGVSALMAKLHGISFEIRVGGSLSGFGREEFDRRRAEIARERALGSQSEAG